MGDAPYKLLPLVKTFFGKTTLTSQEFVGIFRRFDSDNKGFIDKLDIDDFLRDVLRHLKVEFASTYTIDTIKKSFLPTFPLPNGSAELSMRELSATLPTEEENFLLKFRNETKLHISDFMKIWYHYDVDKNGYLEPDELKKFLHDLLTSDNSIPEGDTTDASKSQQLVEEYTDIILNLYDTNNDGKIELSELSKILPVEENFLSKFTTHEMTKDDFDALFDHYDHDGNGYIEDTELVGFIRDLLENKNREPTTLDLEQYRTSIMSICDTNNDGKLSKEELQVLLLGKKNC